MSSAKSSGSEKKRQEQVEPKVGDICYALFYANSRYTWWDAEVVDIKGGYIHVRYEDGSVETFTVGHSQLLIGENSHIGVTKTMTKQHDKPKQSRSIEKDETGTDARSAAKRFGWSTAQVVHGRKCAASDECTMGAAAEKGPTPAGKGGKGAAARKAAAAAGKGAKGAGAGKGPVAAGEASKGAAAETGAEMFGEVAESSEESAESFEEGAESFEGGAGSVGPGAGSAGKGAAADEQKAPEIKKRKRGSDIPRVFSPPSTAGESAAGASATPGLVWNADDERCKAVLEAAFGDAMRFLLSPK